MGHNVADLKEAVEHDAEIERQAFKANFKKARDFAICNFTSDAQ